jgi:polyhydroxyalkanoate synthesis repressor PhaR
MRIIKKYANRKLYDTSDKKYVAMDSLAALIKNGEEVTVIDNRDGRDITSAVVSQLLAREKREDKLDDFPGVLIQLLRRGGGTIMDYAKNADHFKNGIIKSIDNRINEILGKMNLATRSQVNQLNQTIDELMNKIKYLEQVQIMKSRKFVNNSRKKEAVVPPQETER